MAEDEVASLNALIDFLKTRLQQLDRDYEGAIDKIDQIKISHEDHHRLQWQLHRRETEIAELQQALSDAQTQLFDERKQLLKVVAENDELKIQELKDRKKIRYLLSICENPSDEVTYFRDALDKRLVQISVKKKADGGKILDSEKEFIIMEDEIEALRLKITALNTQLYEQAKSSDEIIAGLMRDRKTAADDEKIRRQHESTRIAELIDKLNKLRALNRENTRELLYTKKSTHQNERKLVEEKARLVADLSSIRNRYTTEKERMESLEKSVERNLTKKHEDTLADLRSQINKYEADMRTGKQKLEAAELGHRKKQEYYVSKIQNLTKSYNSLKRRRDYEIEGFTNDILMLRKQLKSLEKSILKYGPLEDRELVLLNLARETGQRVARISSDLQGLKTKLLQVEDDKRSIPI